MTYGRLLHERLPAGVYFFEWYVNDQYLVRVPVLVFSDRQVDAASPADLATIETRMPVRVNVVVMASQASVYADQAVIDTVPQGTVLKASKITQSPDALQRRLSAGYFDLRTHLISRPFILKSRSFLFSRRGSDSQDSGRERS